MQATFAVCVQYRETGCTYQERIYQGEHLKRVDGAKEAWLLTTKRADYDDYDCDDMR